jgi:hypothetical protein
MNTQQTTRARRLGTECSYSVGGVKGSQTMEGLDAKVSNVGTTVANRRLADAGLYMRPDGSIVSARRRKEQAVKNLESVEVPGESADLFTKESP